MMREPNATEIELAHDADLRRFVILRWIHGPREPHRSRWIPWDHAYSRTEAASVVAGLLRADPDLKLRLIVNPKSMDRG